MAENAGIDSQLTPAEIEILGLLASGLTQCEVASFRGTSVQTTKNQLATIREKLGAETSTQAVAKVVQNGLVKLG